MARVLLLIDDLGLAMPLQDGLEAGGHQVQWKQGATDQGVVSADVVLMAMSGGSELAGRVAHYRALDPVPALIAVGQSAAEAEAARACRVPFLPSTASPEQANAAIEHALAHRYAAGLSVAYARGALGIEPLGDADDQIAQIVRESRRVDIQLVQEALRWFPQHYVHSTEVVNKLREGRVLQVPEIELVKLCDGTRTLQTLVRAGAMAPAPSAALLWALASVGAASFTPTPPNAHTRARRAVIVARDHLVARRARLDASTYYDVLEIPPTAEIEHIEHAVQLLARRYSPEALRSIDLGELSELAAPLWQQILKARQTLSDWATRGRYNDWLANHVDELNTTWAGGERDLGRAENSFSRGQAALVEGDAHAAVSQFAAAARAFPVHPDFECSLLWARFRSEIARGREREEVAGPLRAEAEQFNLGRRPWPRALVALALLCAADGDSGAARWHVREALTVDPNLPAARHLWARLGEE